MIRIVTLNDFSSEVLDVVARRLHAAYGMGCEVQGSADLPGEALDEDQTSYEAPKLLAGIEEEAALYADDKIIYLTSEPLTAPPGPMGKGPVDGYAQYGGPRAVATAAGLDKAGAAVDLLLAKRAAHYIGHLWDLHHCFDPRCAMHPGWAPGFTQYPDTALCMYCREKSERKIKLGSSG